MKWIDVFFRTASPELRLLLRSLSAAPAGAASTELVELLTGPLDVARALWLAQRHHVVPRLHYALCRCPPTQVPANLLEPLQRAAQANTLASLRQLKEAQILAQACREAGIDALFSATSLLGIRLHEDVAYFQAGPVTLLCAKDQLERARRLVHEDMGRGVRIAGGQLMPPRVGASFVTVSLLPADSAPFPLIDAGAGGMSSRSVAIHGVPSPDEGDLFRLVGTQSAQRRWRSLTQLDQLAALWARCPEAGAEKLDDPPRPLMTATLLARGLLDAPIPQQAVDRLRRRIGDEELARASEGLLWEQGHPMEEDAERERGSALEGKESGEFGEYRQTPHHLVASILELAEVGPADICYDLGCGNGSILIEAARRCGCRCVGYDIDPDLIQRAEAAARQAGVADRVRFVQQDVLQADLTGATVVFSYLRTRGNLALLPRFRDGLKRGVRIVTRDFHFGPWPPSRTVVEAVGPADVTYLYLWHW